MSKCSAALFAICVWVAPLCAEGAVLPRLEQGEKLTICAIGTSVTGSYWDPANKVSVPSAWFPLLGKWLNSLYPEQVTIHNEGIGGAASKFTPTYANGNGGSGLDVQLDRALAHNPDVLFIEFAVNDAYHKYGISKQASKDNLQEMIDRTRAWAAKHNKSVEIVVQTMNNITHEGDRPEEAAYYQGYRDVAKANGLLLIDHYRNWLKLYDSEEDHATWKSNVPDGAHPNEKGAQIVILPEIQKVLKNQKR